MSAISLDAIARRLDKVAAAAEELDAAAPTAAERLRERFTPRPLAELLAAPAPGWLVRGVLPDIGVVVLSSPPGTGKSFCAYDLAGAVIRGRPWFGRRTKRGAVIYCAAEGAPTLRVKAYMLANRLRTEDMDGLNLLLDAPPILDEDLVRELLDVWQPLAPVKLVVVDTLSRAIAGEDENSNEAMSAVIAGADRLAKALHCCVMLVHHPPKHGTGPRGGSALLGGVETSLTIDRLADTRTLRVEKQREGQDDFAVGCFTLRTVDVDEDEDGESITSCVLEPLDGDPPQAAERLPPKARELLGLVANLGKQDEHRRVSTAEDVRHGAVAGQWLVSLDDVRTAFYSANAHLAKETARKAFNRALDRLKEAREVGLHEGVVWLANYRTRAG